MAPDCRLFPITRLPKEIDDLLFALCIQQADSKIPYLAIVH